MLKDLDFVVDKPRLRKDIKERDKVNKTPNGWYRPAKFYDDIDGEYFEGKIIKRPDHNYEIE